MGRPAIPLRLRLPLYLLLPSASFSQGCRLPADSRSACHRSTARLPKDDLKETGLLCRPQPSGYHEVDLSQTTASVSGNGTLDALQGRVSSLEAERGPLEGRLYEVGTVPGFLKAGKGRFFLPFIGGFVS